MCQSANGLFILTVAFQTNLGFHAIYKRDKYTSLLTSIKETCNTVDFVNLFIIESFRNLRTVLPQNRKTYRNSLFQFYGLASLSLKCADVYELTIINKAISLQTFIMTPSVPRTTSSGTETRLGVIPSFYHTLTLFFTNILPFFLLQFEYNFPFTIGI